MLRKKSTDKNEREETAGRAGMMKKEKRKEERWR
jgi:hypothetical protein